MTDSGTEQSYDFILRMIVYGAMVAVVGLAIYSIVTKLLGVE
ncbi:hypothetical protein ACFLZX_01625 [Nanoarchaeota archaeon]